MSAGAVVRRLSRTRPPRVSSAARRRAALAQLPDHGAVALAHALRPVLPPPRYNRPVIMAAHAPTSTSRIEAESSARRYIVPPGYDPMAQPNPCANVPAAPIVPLQFADARKPVNYEDGWNYYRRIGSPKHVCAPMVNQSELAFRLLCRRYDTTLAFTPMFHAEIFGKDPKYRAEAMQIPKLPQQDRPLVVQFCGNDPQLILKAAKMVEHCADAVDLNCGCPQNIAKRGFYVKIRRLATDEATIALVKMLQEAGAAMITIHGRSRLQLKDKVGSCDFDLIRLVKQNCKVPVFANGGIYSYEDVERCLEYTGVDGVMSSEALLCNPAIFSKKRVEGLQIAREYLDIVADLEQNQGIVTEQSMIRAHLFKMLFRHLSVHTDLRDRLAACPPEEFEPIYRELAERFAPMSTDEREKILSAVPYWYHRHIQTAAQLEEAERKKAQKEAERAERERCMEESCEAINLFD